MIGTAYFFSTDFVSQTYHLALSLQQHFIFVTGLGGICRSKMEGWISERLAAWPWIGWLGWIEGCIRRFPMNHTYSMR